MHLGLSVLCLCICLVLKGNCDPVCVCAYVWVSAGASPMAQWIKHMPAMQATQETLVPFLGSEDALEKGMTTHSSILAWRIPWIKEPGGLQSKGSQRAGHDCETHTHTHTHGSMDCYMSLFMLKSCMSTDHRVSISMCICVQ